MKPAAFLLASIWLNVGQPPGVAAQETHPEWSSDWKVELPSLGGVNGTTLWPQSDGERIALGRQISNWSAGGIATVWATLLDDSGQPIWEVDIREEEGGIPVSVRANHVVPEHNLVVNLVNWSGDGPTSQFVVGRSAATGERLWRTELIEVGSPGSIGASLWGNFGTSNGRLVIVTAGSNSQLSVITELDPLTGAILVEHEAPGVFLRGALLSTATNSVVVYENTTAPSSQIFAIDLATGSPNWSLDDCWGWDLSSDGQTLGVAREDRAEAYDVATGTLLWSTPGPATHRLESAPGSFLVAGIDQDLSDYVYRSLDASTGQVLWEAVHANPGNYYPRISYDPVSDRLAAVQTSTRRIQVLEASTGTLVGDDTLSREPSFFFPLTSTPAGGWFLNQGWTFGPDIDPYALAVDSLGAEAWSVPYQVGFEFPSKALDARFDTQGRLNVLGEITEGPAQLTFARVEPATGEVLTSWWREDDTVIKSSPTISPDGSRVAWLQAKFSDRDLRVFDTEEGDLVFEAEFPSDALLEFTHLRWSPSGDFLVVLWSSSPSSSSYRLYNAAGSLLGEGPLPLVESVVDEWDESGTVLTLAAQGAAVAGTPDSSSLQILRLDLATAALEVGPRISLSSEFDQQISQLDVLPVDLEEDEFGEYTVFCGFRGTLAGSTVRPLGISRVDSGSLNLTGFVPVTEAAAFWPVGPGSAQFEPGAAAVTIASPGLGGSPVLELLRVDTATGSPEYHTQLPLDGSPSNTTVRRAENGRSVLVRMDIPDSGGATAPRSVELAAFDTDLGQLLWRTGELGKWLPYSPSDLYTGQATVRPLAVSGSAAWVPTSSSGSVLTAAPQVESITPSTFLDGGEAASIQSPASVPFVIQRGEQAAGSTYLVLGTTSGTSPSLVLGTTELPLVPDAYTTFTLQFAGSSLYPGSVGVLDDQGSASAALALPTGISSALIGTEISHVCIGLDPALLVDFASNPTSIVLAP